MTLLAIDLGEKRVGLAISRSGIIAEPLTTLEFDEQFYSKLKELCENRGVEKIIIGLPKSLSGEENQQEKRIKEIAEKIAKKTKKETIFEDERFTSKIARERRSGKVDEESAVIILESYLSKSNK